MTSPKSKPAQLQAQLQGQGQLQGQAQGQAQGQGQGQWQYAGVTSESANCNVNGNENGNWNGNENLNGNLNANENLNGNLNANINENIVRVDVDVKVDLTASLAPPTDNDAIDIDHIGFFEEGIVMPDVVSQSVECGNNFNIDQVSNLTDNDTLAHPSVSYNNAGIEAACCRGAADAAGDFSMSTKAEGGTASSSVGDIMGDDGSFAGIGAAAANATLTQEAFTQHIAMGANIQFNSIDQTVVGGDLSDAF
jgi:hypothetical protein